MVAACGPCQRRKGGQLLSEVGMNFRPGFAPRVPPLRTTRPVFLRVLAAAPAEWVAYLPSGFWQQAPD